MFADHPDAAMSLARPETDPGVWMPTKKNVVNLDALIVREDFEAETQVGGQQNSIPSVTIKAFEQTELFFQTLRKPDFQRETASWDPEKIAQFIQSFATGDLVPAVVMWNSKGNNFVIDGCHRVSALIAWVLDDYGDRSLSNDFFRHKIGPDQLKAAEKTRSLVHERVGSYAEMLEAVRHPKSARSQQFLEYAKGLATRRLDLQWVPSADPGRAEGSFFTINTAGAAIEPTELRILKVRKTANALAARAIVRAGTGHKYWARFGPQQQERIETLASEIYDLLFTPNLNTPIRTLDLPVAGRGYSGLPLLFDLVNIVSPVTQEQNPPQDSDGNATLACLRKVRDAVRRISGLHASSMGLHPAVYFYSATGRYQQTAFLAVVSMTLWFAKADHFMTFTHHRSGLEEFLLRHKNFVNDVVRKQGSGIKGYQEVERLFRRILQRLEEGAKENSILTALSKEFPFLVLNHKAPNAKPGKFDSQTKSGIALKKLLEAAPRCPICKSRLHVNSISYDHIQNKADGGLAIIDNGDITHPLCNSLKDKLKS